MCGIAGFLNVDGEAADEFLLQHMTRQLRHRGPDGEGLWATTTVGLGHRRLTIIDLTDNGRQPMGNEDGRIQITFNGEIYNFQELRKELCERGHIFRSTTDTEVIVHLYEEEGLECVRRLNGMFAFALWDAHQKRLFLARDRLGIKPLFYYFDGKHFRFGSEIKAILADPGVDRRVDFQGLHNFLSLNYPTAPLTLFDRIHQLLPAHCLCLEEGHLRTWRYWDIQFRETLERKATAEWAEEMSTVLEAAVRRHLVADVPFGALLSGGVDSSAIVALASEQLGFRLKTFSIGFREESYSELEFARMVAERYDTEHFEKVVEPHMADMLTRLVWHSEDPLADPSSIPMYYLAEMVSSRVKMVISGDGADELFAGYETYQADYLARLYRCLPALVRKSIVAPLVNHLPVSYERYSFEMKARRFVQAADLTPEEAHFSWRMIFSEETKRLLWKDADANERTFVLCREYFDHSPHAHFLNRMLYFDTCFHLPNDILTKVDRMSMAHGLEVRVPFLDFTVVEFAARLPPGLKLRFGMQKKYLLKRVLCNRLPSCILGRSKAGFNIPLGGWLRTNLREMMCDLLTPANLREQGLFDEVYVQRLLKNHLEGIRDYGYELWGLLVLMVWWHLFFLDRPTR